MEEAKEKIEAWHRDIMRAVLTGLWGGEDPERIHP
jgi:hypothetical protein